MRSPAPATRAGLQVGEIGLHARDLSVELAALRRRLRTEKQELAISTAERTRLGSQRASSARWRSTAACEPLEPWREAIACCRRAQSGRSAPARRR